MDLSKVKSIGTFQDITLLTITISYYLFGGFGNIISILIFSSKSFINQPQTVYLNGACVLNIITILYLPIMFLAPIWIINDLNCKLYSGLFIMIIEAQAWVTSMGSFDRMITTLWPHKFSYKNKLVFQLSAIELAIFLVIVSNGPVLFYFQKVNIGNSSTCSLPIETEVSWITIYFKIQYLLFRTLIPFSVMITSSCAITFKMVKMKNRFFNTAHRQREKQLFKSLIALDLFFIIFHLPMLFFVLLYANTEISLEYFYSFQYSLLLAIGLISNVFIFLILIATNRVYRGLFFQYMCCKKF